MLKKCLYKIRRPGQGWLSGWEINYLIPWILSCKAWIELRPASTTMDIFLALTPELQIGDI